MSQATGLVDDILKELTRIQALPVEEVMKGDTFPIPGLIDAGDGQSIVINRKLETLIARLAKTLKDADSTLAVKINDEEWRASVRKALGPILREIDLNAPLEGTAKDVVSGVLRIAKGETDDYPQREHAFGCTLFWNPDIPPFSVGPVRIEPRNLWLDRILDGGQIDKTIHRRVSKAWQGHKLKKRKNNIGRVREHDILSAIGHCPYVCSVSTNGLGAATSRDRSLLAARLGLMTVALLWDRPSSVLNGFNLLYERRVRSAKALVFIPGTVTLAGSRLVGDPHGPQMEKADWAKELQSKTEYFKACGEIIASLLSPDGRVARPAMMNTLAQALIWFEQGCRDSTALMAIIAYSASMDALGSGRKAKGILEVLEARTGIGLTL